MKVKSILVSQPEPQVANSPYSALADKHKVKIDFQPFIEVIGIPGKEFRKDKISVRDFKSFIFTSRIAIDHFFRMCKEMRVPVSPEWKYFCTSEAVAFYLQKFVPYRKRKIYPGKGSLADLIPMLKKQRGEHFMMPTSDILNPDIPNLLEKSNIEWTRAKMYQTVICDLSHLSDVKYDILVFFSPEGIRSLLRNFPKFEQGETLIAGFGNTTKAAIEENDLRLDIAVPTAKFTSMTQALDSFIEKSKNK
ncbi:MAG: uroporphyrinogen-III synthase [Cryomorphaceae bacterium]|jgi:uroporphyrinogen-III synthase|nr:uroporphyrinogen-III synthase [Cryomorphaceae bacterium]|tara:strand:- start:20910 stop:21656 length:747 start_codon:yes stop_codon:yes gene_type:complete